MGSWCLCSKAFSPCQRSTPMFHVSPQSISTGSWCLCSHFFRYCLQLGLFRGRSNLVVKLLSCLPLPVSGALAPTFLVLFFKMNFVSAYIWSLRIPSNLGKIRITLIVTFCSFCSLSSYLISRVQQLLLELEIRFI